MDVIDLLSFGGGIGGGCLGVGYLDMFEFFFGGL